MKIIFTLKETLLTGFPEWLSRLLCAALAHTFRT